MLLCLLSSGSSVDKSILVRSQALSFPILTNPDLIIMKCEFIHAGGMDSDASFLTWVRSEVSFQTLWGSWHWRRLQQTRQDLQSSRLWTWRSQQLYPFPPSSTTSFMLSQKKRTLQLHLSQLLMHWLSKEPQWEGWLFSVDGMKMWRRYTTSSSAGLGQNLPSLRVHQI